MRVIFAFAGAGYVARATQLITRKWPCRQAMALRDISHPNLLIWARVDCL
jgi:hypothetical protein